MTHTQRIPVPQLKADAPANQLCKITQLIPALAGTAGFGTQRGPLVRWQAGARGPPPVPFRETEGGPLAGAISPHMRPTPTGTGTRFSAIQNSHPERGKGTLETV